MRDAVTLLIPPDGTRVYPFNASFGLAHAQGPLASVRARSVGWTILFADGSHKEIRALRPEAEGVLAALFRRLKDYRIVCDLAPSAMTLVELKRRIDEGVKPDFAEADPHSPWPILRSGLNTFLTRLETCATPTEIHRALNLPRAEDCLDLL